jgi:DIM1 family U5 snRNP protein
MVSEIADVVKNFAVIYLVNQDEVKDFNQMYEIYDPFCIMFFFRNKHMMCDLGYVLYPLSLSKVWLT